MPKTKPPYWDDAARLLAERDPVLRTLVQPQQQRVVPMERPRTALLAEPNQGGSSA
jgi:hypothetical protein